MSFWNKGTELANVSNWVFKFPNISIKGIPLRFAVKSYKNFQNTPVFIFLKIQACVFL
jgi:hypothetical protein